MLVDALRCCAVAALLRPVSQCRRGLQAWGRRDNNPWELAGASRVEGAYAVRIDLSGAPPMMSEAMHVRIGQGHPDERILPSSLHLKAVLVVASVVPHQLDGKRRGGVCPESGGSARRGCRFRPDSHTESKLESLRVRPNVGTQPRGSQGRVGRTGFVRRDRGASRRLRTTPSPARIEHGPGASLQPASQSAGGALRLAGSTGLMRPTWFPSGSSITA